MPTTITPNGLAVVSRNGRAPPTGEKGYGYEGYVDIRSEVIETTFPDIPQIREMIRRDSQGQAVDNALTLPIRRNTYDIEAAAGGERAAKLARRVLLYPAEEGGMTTPMSLIIAQMTTGIAYAKACFEKVWENKPEGTILRKLAFRPAITCRIKLDSNGTFDGFVQHPVGNAKLKDPVTFKPSKAFVYLHQAHIDPGEGRSAYIAAYNRYQHKKKVESLLFQHLSRFAGGVRWGKYGGPEGKAGARAFFDNLKSIRGQGTIVTGPEDEIEMLNSDTTEEFLRTLGHLNSEMARAVLCQFLMLGTEANVGSWALSKDHSDFFLLALEAIMREMENYINKYLIGPLVGYNFPSPKMPRFRFEALDETLTQLATGIWKELILKGAFELNSSFFPAMDEKARQGMGIPPEAVTIPAPNDQAPIQPIKNPTVPAHVVPGADTQQPAPGDQSQAARQAQAQDRTRQPAGVSPGGVGTPGNSKI